MKKKLLVGGVALGLAGLTVYRLINQQKQSDREEEVWTTADMPDLTGKVIIVTGANSGIGFEAAKEFARHGGQTILACRNMEKAEAALEEIQAEIVDAPAEIMELDLASLSSVHRFAEQFKEGHSRLDILVNNAGIMMVPYGLTEDNFERQFGTNHLGHFALTGLLSDLLLDTPGSRVVNISSNAHNRGRVDFEDMMYENNDGYTPMDAYDRSKLANILFTNELQRRYETIGADAMAVSAHPGISATNLADHMMQNRLAQLGQPLIGMMVQSAAMGALPTLRAAVDPNAKGGDYYGPDGYRSMRGYPVLVPTSTEARNTADAQKLWEMSEELTGISFGKLDKNEQLNS